MIFLKDGNSYYIWSKKAGHGFMMDDQYFSSTSIPPSKTAIEIATIPNLLKFHMFDVIFNGTGTHFNFMRYMILNEL
jgi:hypothetical protein